MSASARRALPALGMVPFLGYLTIFLFIPTIVIVVGAFVCGILVGRLQQIWALAHG